MFRFDGAKARTLRQAQRIRPEGLALACDRSAPSVLQYESGRVTPPLPVAAAIAEALGVELRDLVTKSQP